MANLLNYNTSGLTGSVTITDKQGSDSYHFNVTITGNSDGTFTDLKATYENSDGYAVTNTPFKVSGKVGTLTVDCYKGSTIKITGNFAAAITGPQITNNIINTTAKSVSSGTDYTITVEGTAQGMFNGSPVASYGGTNYDMTVNNQTATIIVPINTTSVIINGEYLLGEYIEINYGLTNCEIVGDKPVKVKTGQSYTFNLKANQNAELTEINTNFTNVEGNTVSINGTISADKQTATITFDLPTGSEDLTVHVNANVIQPPEITNYGAINVYVVTLDNLAEFAKKRFFKATGESGTGETYSEINLGAYVNRIKRIFTSVHVGGDDVLKCGNYDTGINVKSPKSDIISLDFGNVEVPAPNGDITDYESDIKIFIPFNGFVSLPNDYVGEQINLQIDINVITGDGVARLINNGVLFQVVEVRPSRDVLYRTSTDLTVIGSDNWNETLSYGIEPFIYCKYFTSKNNNGRNTDLKRGVISSFNGFNTFEDVTIISSDNMLTYEQRAIYDALERGIYIS